MAGSIPAYAVPVESRERLPKLRDRKRYKRVGRIPVFYAHKRTVYRKDGFGHTVPVEEEVDEHQLRQICENSQRRSDRGDYGIVFLGHTTDDGPETAQPPVVGYLRNYQMGERYGRPAILASMYLDQEQGPSGIVQQYPRRSPEIIGIEKPDGFIDALALLKRTPELDLGLVSSYAMNGFGRSRFRSNRRVYRYECSECEGESSMPMPTTMADPGHERHKAKRGIATDALKLLKGLIFHVLDDEFNEQPSGHSSEPSGPSGHEEFDEPSGPSDEFKEFDEHEELDEPSGPSSMEMEGGGEEFDEHDEPSMPSEPSRHSHHSRHRLDPSMGGSPSGPSDPSMMEPSGPSGPSGPSQPSRHRLDPSVQPHHHTSRYSDESLAATQTPHGSGRVPISPQTSRRGKPSRHQAGSPGPMSVSTPKPAASGKAHSATQYAGPVPKGKRHGHHGVTRMQRDQEAISVSRFQRQILAENESLKQRLDEMDHRRRESDVERRVIQLEAEGFDLDRQREVSRFMKLKDDEINQEIDHIRKYYRQSPVNQPMIPGLEGDLRANDPASRNPSRFSLQGILEPGPEDEIIGQTGPGESPGATRIWGLSALKDADLKLNHDDSPTDRAMKTIDRFRARNGERRTG